MHNHNLFIIPLQVALWKVSHNKDPNVPKPSEKNGWTKNHVEGLEPLWTMERYIAYQLGRHPGASKCR